MTLLAKVHKLVFPYMTLASDRVRWLPLNLECNISSCLWSPVTTGQAIIFCRGGFFFLSSSFAISSPILSGRRLHVYIPYFYTWCDVSANLECRSEMCCMWLAEIQDAKIRQVRTIAQVCRAISCFPTKARKKFLSNSNVLTSNITFLIFCCFSCVM